MSEPTHTQGRLEIVLGQTLLEITDDGSVNAVCDAHDNVDAERLMSCWNAMQGITDPAAFMLDVRTYFDDEMYAELSYEHSLERSIYKHLKGGT